MFNEKYSYLHLLVFKFNVYDEKSCLYFHTTSRFWLAIPIKKITPSEKTCIQSCRSYFYNFQYTMYYYLGKNLLKYNFYIYILWWKMLFIQVKKNWNRSIRINKKINNIKQIACMGKNIYSNRPRLKYTSFKLSNSFFLTFFYFLIECPFFKYCQIFD